VQVFPEVQYLPAAHAEGHALVAFTVHDVASKPEEVPTGQLLQAELPVVEVYWPAGQLAHADSDTDAEKVPAAHTAHAWAALS